MQSKQAASSQLRRLLVIFSTELLAIVITYVGAITRDVEVGEPIAFGPFSAAIEQDQCAALLAQ